MCLNSPDPPTIEAPKPVTPQTIPVVMSPLANPYEDESSARAPGLNALRIGRGGLNSRFGGPGQRVKLGRWEANTAGTKRAAPSGGTNPTTIGVKGEPTHIDPRAAGILDYSN